MNLLKTILSIPWQLRAGDSTFTGWLTTAIYLAAAVLCAACAWHARRIFIHRLAWGGTAAGLVFLGVNKQLDLQSWLIATGRAAAEAQGWYEMRHVVQVSFILGISLAGLALLAWMAWSLRKAWRQYWLLLAGLFVLFQFILVRAAIFNHVSLPQLSRFTGGFRINSFLEILGALAIAVAALVNLHRSSRKPIQAVGR
jgi:hypothetical protein